jgi:mannose-6-phosphate isomerase-like protein (cupin superfamily)
MSMQFIEYAVQGLRRMLVAEGIDPRRLHVHLSEIGPGSRAHPAHTHDGVEAFLVLEGNGTVETEGSSHPIGPEECLVLDATREHGLVNTGPGKLRYLVITAP